MFDAAMKEFGRLDILVNNSGVYQFAPLEDITEAQFHRQFDINVLGLLLTTQAAAKHLGEGGSVINIGSVVSHITPPHARSTAGPRARWTPSPACSRASWGRAGSASTRSTPA